MKTLLAINQKNQQQSKIDFLYEISQSRFVTPFAFLTVIGIGILSVYFLIICFLGILPSLAARLIDKTTHYATSRIVLSFNLVALLWYMIKIIKSSNPNRYALELLTDPYTWLEIYSYCAIGWIIYFIVPILFVQFSLSRARFTIGQLKKQSKEIKEEWGIDTTSSN